VAVLPLRPSHDVVLVWVFTTSDRGEPSDESRDLFLIGRTRNDRHS
jgi:hypothetical protein